MSFKDSIVEFSKEVLEFQSSGVKEQIEEDDVVKAMVIINFIQYENIADIFLGCSALNLLNTYVKQAGAKINYQFRRHLINLIKGIEDFGINKSLQVYFDEKKNIIMFIIHGFQFSFHGERHSEMVKRLESKQEIEWDGIRKQLCAKTIFDFAYDSVYISDSILNGDSLLSYVEDELENFHLGKYKFINGQLIKIKGIQYNEDDMNKVDKNYFRKKLYSCQDRPVILIGSFKKVWSKHVTFTTIRPYIQGCRTITVCDHINLFRPDVEAVLDINSLEKDNKYYIIGYCNPYGLNGSRMGVCLAKNYPFPPLFRVSDSNLFQKEIFSECHRFSIDEYLSKKNRHLKL